MAVATSCPYSLSMFLMTVFGDGAAGIEPQPVLQVRGGPVDGADSVPGEPGDEIRGVLDNAREVWPSFESFEPLLRRAIAEGVESDLLLGEQPETFSPLAGLKTGSFGLFTNRERAPSEYPEIAEEWAGSPDLETTIEASNDFLPGGQAVLRMISTQEGTVIGAVAFGAQRFVAPLPSQLLDDENSSRSLIRLEYQLSDRFERTEAQAIADALHAEMPDVDIVPMLIWRTYIGSNSDTLDGSSTVDGNGYWLRARRLVGRIGHQSTNQAGILVGRLAWTVTKRVSPERGDRTAQPRRRRLERGDPDTTAKCPDVQQVTTESMPAVAPIEAVIAIHGTMSCAIPMARAIQRAVPAGVSVLRFEHDTWLPIQTNAAQLADEVIRLGIRRALLVAHSRGGLVARSAAKRIARESQGAVDVSILTIGTPFLGTPIVNVAELGLLGVNALLGLVRAAGGAALDAGTRLAGYMLKSDLPRGIEQMNPRLDFIMETSDQITANHTAIAGIAPTLSDQDTYGISFLSGFSEQLFHDEDNDLVVAARSALGTSAPPPIVVDCDHFSYFTNTATIEEIAAKAAVLKPTWQGTFSRRSNLPTSI